MCAGQRPSTDCELLVLQPAPSCDDAALEDQGWDHFRVVVGPAAGPRNLLTMGWDAQMSAQHGQRRPSSCGRPTWLVGGSFSALRFCALISQVAARQRGVKLGCTASEDLVNRFSCMVYREGDTPSVLDPMMKQLFATCCPCPDDILSSPDFRLAICVATIQPWAARLPRLALHALFYTFLAANVVTPHVLPVFQRRLCFYTGLEPPPFYAADSGVSCIPLTHDNIYQVLHATTCVPFVSEDCTYIEGVGRGLFYDGALVDYQLGAVFRDPHLPVLLLGMDCPGAAIKANIWDSVVPWRGVGPAAMRHVSVLSPLPAFKAQLGGRDFPSTWDFFNKAFMARPQLRISAWLHAYQLSVAATPAHPSALVRRRGLEPDSGTDEDDGSAALLHSGV